MISIVVPARNEEDKIGDLLESIRKNDFDDYEVIVVDGDSSDRTVEIAESYGARTIQGPLKGTAAARNKGWKEARGDYIYFLDADSKLPEDALKKISREIEKSSPGLIRPELEIISSSFVGNIVREENRMDFEDSFVGRVIEKVMSVLI